MPPKTKSNIGKDTATSDVEVAPTIVGLGQEGIVPLLVEQIERNLTPLETHCQDNEPPAGPVVRGSNDTNITNSLRNDLLAFA